MFRLHLLVLRHLGSVFGIAVHNRRGPFRWQWRQPAVLRGENPVRGDECKCSTAGSFTHDERHSGRLERHEVRKRSRDFTCEPTFFSRLGQRRSGRVDDGDKRNVQLSSQGHASAGLAKCRRAHRFVTTLTASVLSQNDRGR